MESSKRNLKFEDIYDGAYLKLCDYNYKRSIYLEQGTHPFHYYFSFEYRMVLVVSDFFFDNKPVYFVKEGWGYVAKESLKTSSILL
jgi:hypothetical protein